MSIPNLTGSENLRFKEIDNNWLVFEPLINGDLSEKFANLYTVSLGQNYSSELLIDSSSFDQDTVSGAIIIEKIIHQFDSETEASEFLTDFGEENIVSRIDTIETSDLYENSELIEIQIVNLPEFDVLFNLTNKDINKGFIVEVFKSGSIEEGGTQKAESKISIDRYGRLISDPYVQYFKIKNDI